MIIFRVISVLLYCLVSQGKLSVDGGMTVNSYIMQLQADVWHSCRFVSACTTAYVNQQTMESLTS